jgi:hypothetical protein
VVNVKVVLWPHSDEFSSSDLTAQRKRANHALKSAHSLTYQPLSCDVDLPETAVPLSLAVSMNGESDIIESRIVREATESLLLASERRAMSGWENVEYELI